MIGWKWLTAVTGDEALYVGDDVNSTFPISEAIENDDSGIRDNISKGRSATYDDFQTRFRQQWLCSATYSARAQNFGSAEIRKGCVAYPA